MISKENIWILLDRNFKLKVKNELYNDAYNWKREEFEKEFKKIISKDVVYDFWKYYILSLDSCNKDKICHWK